MSNSATPPRGRFSASTYCRMKSNHDNICAIIEKAEELQLSSAVMRNQTESNKWKKLYLYLFDVEHGPLYGFTPQCSDKKYSSWACSTLLKIVNEVVSAASKLPSVDHDPVHLKAIDFLTVYNCNKEQHTSDAEQTRNNKRQRKEQMDKASDELCLAFENQVELLGNFRRGLGNNSTASNQIPPASNARSVIELDTVEQNSPRRHSSMFSFNTSTTRSTQVSPTPFPGNGRAVGSGGRRDGGAASLPQLQVPQLDINEEATTQQNNDNNNNNQQNNNNQRNNNNNIQQGQLLHREMRHEGQDPDATLLAHFNNVPVDRQVGQAENGTLHTRAVDLAYFIDHAANRQQAIDNNLVNHQVAVANSCLNQGRELQMIADLAAVNNDLLPDDAYNELKDVFYTGVMQLAASKRANQQRRQNNNM